MDYNGLIEWLLEGDPAIIYRTKKELLKMSEASLVQLKVSLPYVDGYVKQYFDYRDKDTGQWAQGIYLPKWTSTHYTMLELKNLNCPGDFKAYNESAQLLLDEEWWLPKKARDRAQDLCVIAMMGSIVCHAKILDPRLNTIIDYMLTHIQPDGGFNCSWQRSKVSSVHTTLTVLEFFLDYETNGYLYRLDEIQSVAIRAEQWLLERNLYQDKTSGQALHKTMTNLPYPTRYKFDFLKALEYFANRKRPHDKGLDPALDLLEKKRLSTGQWPCTGNHGRDFYFDMKNEGKGQRFNTLRALKVLSSYRPDAIQ